MLWVFRRRQGRHSGRSTLGSAIFGVALLRKGTLPKAGAPLVAVGPVALFALFLTGNQQAMVPIMASVVATGLGWALLGIGLRAERAASSGRKGTAARPEPAVR